MAAVTEIIHRTGAAATPTNTAVTSVVFNRADNNTTTAITIPGTGTNFSYYKAFYLNVTTADATNISNRTFWIDGADAAGLEVYYSEFNTDTYVQADGTNPADSGTANAAPTAAAPFSTAGWTLAPEAEGSGVVWDSASVSANTTGKNGQFIVVVVGVSSGHGLAGGSNALPALKFKYTEGP